MGEAKDGRAKKKEKPDRLAEAIAKKVETLTVDDRELHIRKWDFHTSLELMSKLGDVLKLALGGIGPSMDIGSILQQEIGQLLLPHEDKIVEVLAGSILNGNFENLEQAEAWVRGLGADEVLRIFSVIAKQNIRPLVKAVGEIAKEVGAKVKVSADTARKVSQAQT